MRDTADVVVGGGIIGASIAYHLVEAGVRRVELCERDVPGGAGATARSGGLIRMPHTNGWQMRLAWQSDGVDAGWAEIVGGDCGFRRAGFALVVGHEHVDHLHRNVAAMHGTSRRTG